MKLHQSYVLNNLNKWPLFYLDNRTRDEDGIFLLWKIIEYFQPTTILEVGMFAGQSTGIMIEASNSRANITSIDISTKHLDFFNTMFPSNNVNFINSDSRIANVSGTFDFILLDGSPDVSIREVDLKKYASLLHKNSILCIDEYKILVEMPDIVELFLEENKDWVPFLCGERELFLHHVSHRADKFLDVYLQEKSKNFFQFENKTIGNNTVLSVTSPKIFTDSTRIFVDVLKFYDL